MLPFKCFPGPESQPAKIAKQFKKTKKQQNNKLNKPANNLTKQQTTNKTINKTNIKRQQNLTEREKT